LRAPATGPGFINPGHPFLSERMKSLHAAVAARAAREPSSRLLLGIARDRVLYKDIFLGQGHPLIANFTETLYLHQVATLGLDGEATSEGLLAFFRSLHDSRSGKTNELPMEFLKREGIRGIHLYPYNYLAPPGDGLVEDPDDSALSVEISLTRSLADECSDSEFLDLLATLLSAEEKGGKRLRKIFEIIAADRDIRGSLLPKLDERARESLRAKNYYAVKTWETIEKLLLARSETAYLEKDHSRFMEALSGDTEPRAGMPERRKIVDPAVLVPFEESGIRRRAAFVLLELLWREKIESDFLALLEEIRKMIPNLISRKEFTLLEKILGALSSIQGKASRENAAEVRKVIQEVDFGQVIDLYLSRGSSGEEEERSGVILTVFGEEAVHPLLERLLMEQEANRRRTLISLAVRMGGCRRLRRFWRSSPIPGGISSGTCALSSERSGSVEPFRGWSACSSTPTRG